VIPENMITTAIRPASLQEESRLTPSAPTPRKRMNEITRINKGAMSVLLAATPAPSREILPHATVAA
jgi:hypothetical protein